MPEIIDIDMDAIPTNIAAFVNLELDKCRANGVSITMPKHKVVISQGMRCAGFFEDKPPEFAVAVSTSIRTWLPTFVHESCHMDQWIENSNLWNRLVNNRQPTRIFDQWLSGQVELDDAMLTRVISAIMDIEFDCEKRSVEKIKQHGLPIKIDTYIRKSNAYVWSYRIVQETRNWDHSGVYDYPSIWRKMDKSFHPDYKKISPDVRKLFMDQIAILEKDL